MDFRAAAANDNHCDHGIAHAGQGAGCLHLRGENLHAKTFFQRRVRQHYPISAGRQPATVKPPSVEKEGYRNLCLFSRRWMVLRSTSAARAASEIFPPLRSSTSVMYADSSCSIHLAFSCLSGSRPAVLGGEALLCVWAARRRSRDKSLRPILSLSASAHAR